MLNARKNRRQKSLMNSMNARYSSQPLFSGTLAVGLLLTGTIAVKADVAFYASANIANIDQISSSGQVSTFAQFLGSSDLPEGLAFGQNGTLYIADAGQGQLWKCTPGGALSPWAATGNQMYSYGLLAGSDGNFFAAIDDSQGGQIDEITSGGTVTTFAALPAHTQPFGLVFNSSGDLLVADSQFNKIYEVTPGGTVSTFLSFSSADSLTGLAFDSTGNLYIADYGGSIYKVTPGGVESTFVTLGTGTGPKGLAFDNGDLFVAEQNANEIAEITPQGSVENFASIYAPQFIEVVPEPSVLAVLSAGFLAFAAHWRRKAAPRF